MEEDSEFEVIAIRKPQAIFLIVWIIELTLR